MQTNTAGKQQITPSVSPAPPTTSPLSKPNYNALASLSSPQPISNKPDAFANLSNRGTPVSSGSSSQPLFQLQQQKQQQQSQLQSQNGGGGDLDDWADFASALPPASNVPPLQANEVLVLSSNLHIIVAAEREYGNPDGAILLKARFSNACAQPINELTFQMAVPKVSSDPTHLTPYYLYKKY